MALFTRENSRLAALLHGDPNEVHLNQRFGKTIAPGLMQLQGFLAMHGWQKDCVFDVSLINPVIVPCNATYSATENGYSLTEQDKTYATLTMVPLKKLDPKNVFKTYRYSATDKETDPESLDWRAYSSVPVDLVKRIVPPTDTRTLQRLSFVGLAANALVRYLTENPTFLPEMFFPQAREDGEYAVLEQKLVLYTGDVDDASLQNGVELGVMPSREIDNKSFIASIAETNGLYTLDIYLKKIPKRVFARLLR